MNSPAAPNNKLRKAYKALESSRLLLDHGDDEGACNRAYFAMFHAAKQALDAAAPGAEYKTHSGLVAAFSKEFVLPGMVDSAIGRSLARVQQTRMVADYSEDAPRDVDVQLIILQAETFLKVIDAMLLKLIESPGPG